MYSTIKVAEAVRQVAQENPSGIYERYSNPASAGNKCFYTKGIGGNGCGCLIGQAIVKVYPELKKRLEVFDKSDLTPGAHVLFHEEYLNFDKLDAKSIVWMRDVQYWQDKGNTWSDAIDYANGV